MRFNAPEVALAEHGGRSLSPPAPATGPSPPFSSSARPTAGERPGALGLAANGTVTGTVLDSVTHAPVGGVNVTATSVYGLLCPGCGFATTDSTGGFTVVAASGAVELTFSVDSTTGYYLDNKTWTTVVGGSTISVGTIYLVHDGYVKGVVESAVPGHPPIANVQVLATSRDGSITAYPLTVSKVNGSFLAPTPPLPARVEFVYSPPPPQISPYFPNVTYVNASPYQTIDLGTVFLEGDVPVHAEFWDRVTNAVLPNSVLTQLTVCTQRETACLPPINTTRGGTRVEGWALPGPAFVRALALGYVMNQTWVPDIPNSNSSVDLGRIFLEPLGGIEVSTNFTGGVPSTGGWAKGLTFEYTICSLDGVSATVLVTPGLLGPSLCWSTPGSINATVAALGTPFHDLVILTTADSGGGFPVESASLPLVPGFPLTEEANVTWVNLTPDVLLPVPSLDLTAGTYLAGTVAILGASGNLSGRFSVEACSTDEPAVCGPTVGSSDLDPGGAGCPTATNTFCAPSPPGPVELRVTAFGNGSPVSGTNRTWLEVPSGCCAQDGHPTDVGLVNVSLASGWGAIDGSIAAAAAGGGPVVPLIGVLASVQACPVAGQSGAGGSACTSGFSEPANGTFSLPAVDGWDRITVVAAGYTSNWTWVFVNGTNTTGTIVVAADAVVTGRVVDPSGHGIYAALVSVCPVPVETLCTGPGGVLSSTDGQFNITVPGAPIPSGDYEVHVQASGFVANWTWLNTTPGRLAEAGPITLDPTGGSPMDAAPRAALAPAGMSWLTGRLSDNRSGLGVPGAVFDACTLARTACALLDGTSTLDGRFNLSVPRGAFDLEVNATGYTTQFVYVNLSANALDLGSVTMAPYAWVRGRFAIDPWESLAAGGLGAGAVEVVACDSSASACGLAGVTATDGEFNVSAPFGTPILLTARGAGPDDVFGTAQGGFTPATLSVAVTQSFVDLSSLTGTASPIAVFGAVTGSVWNGDSWDATGGIARAPAGFASANASVPGLLSSTASAITGGGGNFTLFLPDGGSSRNIFGFGGAYLTSNLTQSGAVTPGAQSTVGPLVLTHYGYVEGRVGAAGGPVGDAVLEVSRADPANLTLLQSSAQAAQDGFVNATAPPGFPVAATVSAPGYTNLTKTVSVTPGQTSALGRVQLAVNASQAPAWVQSAQVNAVGHPPTATVVDGATGRPLRLAEVVVAAPSGSASQSTQTNALGQFLIQSPAGSPDVVAYEIPGFAFASAAYNVAAGARLIVPRVNLSGDGVVAGRVVVDPGGAPLAYVEVDGCDALGLCSTLSYTNGNGVFWIDAPTGLETIRVSTEAYLTNQTLLVQVASDSWTWAGTLHVYAFATLIGSVRAIPSLLPVPSATVALCATQEVPYGPCGFSVPTDTLGRFTLPAPPGTYVLAVSAPGFNTTAFPLALPPGAVINLGTIFLFAWGLVHGSVVSAVNSTPIVGATVQACADSSPTTCSAVVNTSASGAYLLLGPPGPDTLIASAYGYAVTSAGYTVAAGEPNFPPPIALLPLAPEVLVDLAGTVVAANTSAPIPGAFIGLEQGHGAVAATTSGPGGAFDVKAYWGAYTLVAQAGGYRPTAEPLTLHANTSGLRVVLAPYVYALRGTVRDGTTGAGVPGVTIERGTTVLGTSDAQGAFAVGLANGSYSLNATPPPGSVYGALTFEVRVSGSDLQRDLILTMEPQPLVGTVVDSTSGLPVSGATLTAYATAPGRSSAAASSSATGRFNLSLTPGSYLLNISAPGYRSASLPVLVSNATAPLVVPLVRVGPEGGGFAVPPWGWAAAVGLVGVAAVVVLTIRRRRRTPREPEPVGEDDPASLPVEETEATR